MLDNEGEILRGEQVATNKTGLGPCVCCGAEYYGLEGTMHPFCESTLLRPVSTMQAARPAIDPRAPHSIPSDARERRGWLGLRRLAHQPRDVRMLY